MGLRRRAELSRQVFALGVDRLTPGYERGGGVRKSNRAYLAWMKRRRSAVLPWFDPAAYDRVCCARIVQRLASVSDMMKIVDGTEKKQQ